MKRKQKLAIMSGMQTELRTVLVSLQRKQLELLDSITLQLEDDIQSLEIAKQELKAMKIKSP